MKKKLYFLFCFFSFRVFSNSALIEELHQQSPTDTSRLKSTAGVGIGTILMDEATLLNPSTLSFYNITSFYAQKRQTGITSSREMAPSGTNRESNVEEYNFILSDSKAGVDASARFSMLNAHEKGKLTQYAGALSSPLGAQSAIGVSYVYQEFKKDETKTLYRPITLGVHHVFSEAFSVGIIWKDALKDNKNLGIVGLGLQYNFSDFFSFLADVGGNPYQNIREKGYLGAAMQLRLYGDLYGRGGIKTHRGEKSQTVGVGLGWVQPRLVLEGSYSTKKFTQNQTEIKDLGVSLSFRF